MSSFNSMAAGVAHMIRLCLEPMDELLTHHSDYLPRDSYCSFSASTNTHIPAPFWTAVVPVMVPLSSCNRAADLLIDWFGPEELKAVVGGERWWQVRGMDGIASEWITEGRFLDDAEVAGDGEKMSDDEETIKKMEKLETVMVRASEP